MHNPGLGIHKPRFKYGLSHFEITPNGVSLLLWLRETMDIYDVLRGLPLVSAAVWFSLAGLQVYRDRMHTWTEIFFLLACISAGLYAIWDFLFFTAQSEAIARFAGLVSLSSAVTTALFLLLFTLVYIDRMRPVYWSFAVVTALILTLVWTVTLSTVVPTGTIWIPIFNATAFLVVLAYIAAYSVGGIWNLYRLHRIVRNTSPQLARRTRGFLIVFTFTLILGLGTNGAFGALRSQFPPPFSSLLLVVAGATIYTLYPGSRQRISEAVRRFQAQRYSIKAAFITFEDGTLIGSQSRAGGTVIDQDLFGATLDVIQNFMKTSFPILRGKSLSAITHGSYTLVVERGRKIYITVVLEGEETDQLRRQMRDLLLDFEAKNRTVLTDWRGIPADASGTDELLTSLFAETPAV
jgi:hypothetical protein